MDSSMENITSDRNNTAKTVKPFRYISGRAFLPSFFLSCPPADLAGRITVDFLEHAAEQFVIGKTVLVKHLQDGFVCRTDVVVDVSEPHVVDMLREGNTDVLPEHAAEIVAVETEDIRDLFKGQRLHIVLVDIGNDLLDSELIAAWLGEIFFI